MKRNAITQEVAAKPFATQTTIRSPAISWADVVTLTLGLIVLTFGLDGYGFYEPHEGHFGGVAREMLLREDWVTPTLNGAPYLNKPPLLYWLVATSTALLGLTEYAARLPLAIAGWLGVMVAWKWARELWTPASGCIAALMLSVAIGWFTFTHQLLIDVLLATLLLTTYYCLWRLVWHGGWVYFLALYLLLGLCVLAKGPSMLVFPFICGMGLVLARWDWAIVRKLRPILGASVTLLVTLPWAIAVERANPGFLQYFLFNENLKRIADTRYPPDYEISKVSAIGYLAVTAIWCLPWILVLPQAIYFAWQDWKQGIGHQRKRTERAWGIREWTDGQKKIPNHQFPITNPQSPIPNPKSDGLLLLIIAAVLPVLLFLPLSSRLVYYSVPAIAPFTILCAGWWSHCQDSWQRQGRIVAGISFALFGLAVCIASIWAPGWLGNFPELSNYPINLGGIIVAIALPVGIGCLIGGVGMLLVRPHLALVAIFIGLFAGHIALTHGFAIVQDFRSSKTLIETANPHLGLTTLWTFEGSRELGAAGAMAYYLDHRGNGEKGWRERRSTSISLPLTPGLRPATLTPPHPLIPGWAKGKGNTAYRIVMVLTDGGANRLPPNFPGSRPEYAITKQELQDYWNSSRPVVFVTDFLRQPNDATDPLDLNLPQNAGDPLLVIEPRKLYGNLAARQLWFQHREYQTVVDDYSNLSEPLK